MREVVLKFKELERIIKADGCRLADISGSHYQYKHPVKPGRVTIPTHKGELKRKIVQSAMKQAGLN